MKEIKHKDVKLYHPDAWNDWFEKCGDDDIERLEMIKDDIFYIDDENKLVCEPGAPTDLFIWTGEKWMQE